jgi:hypothetical protein
MSRQDNESKAVYHISGAYKALLPRRHYDILSPGGHGGQGGPGHGNGGMGGSGGTGEGPTVIFDHSTNKMYVGEAFPVPFPKSFLNNTSVNLGHGLIKFPVLPIFQAESRLDLKKFCASGWEILPIQRTDSTTCGSNITKPLGTGSHMITDS